jgi:hypothetical protein
MRKALMLASYPGMLFSKLNDHGEWISSSAFNRVYSKPLPESIKLMIITTIKTAASKFPTYALPSGKTNFFILVHDMLRFDTIKSQLVAHTRYLKGGVLDNRRKEPYEPFITQFVWVIQPLFIILWEHFNRLILSVRSYYTSVSDLELKSFSELWAMVETIEDLKISLSNLSEYRKTKEVISVGNSKLLKEVESVRSILYPLLKENKVRSNKPNQTSPLRSQ